MDNLLSLRIKSIIEVTRKEGILLWLAIAYIIAEYVRPQSIYTPLYGFPLSQVVILLAIVARFLKPEQLVRHKLNILMFAYMFVVIISSIFAIYPPLSFDHWIDFTQWLIIYFLLINLINNEKRFYIVIIIFMLVNFKMALHGFKVWTFRGFSFTSWGIAGPPGWFENSGEFGIAMCVFVPISYFMLQGLKDNISRLKYRVLLSFPIFGIGSIVASSSRGAMVGILAVFIWYTFKSKYKFRALLFLIVATAILYIVTPEESLDRFSAMGEDSDSQNRIRYWLAGWEMMKDRPLFGIGYGNWVEVYKNYYMDATVSLKHELPHNIFVQAGAELGFIGLLVYLMIIFAFFKTNKNVRSIASEINDKFAFNLSKGLDGAMIGFLASGSFVSVLYYPYFWFNLVFCVSLCWFINKKKEKIAMDL